MKSSIAKKKGRNNQPQSNQNQSIVKSDDTSAMFQLQGQSVRDINSHFQQSENQAVGFMPNVAPLDNQQNCMDNQQQDDFKILKDTELIDSKVNMPQMHAVWNQKQNEFDALDAQIQEVYGEYQPQVMDVESSWRALKSGSPDDQIGPQLFTQILILNPSAFLPYGVSNQKELQANNELAKISKTVIAALEEMIFAGSSQSLKEILTTSPHLLQFLSEALIRVLSASLDPLKFTDQTRLAWRQLFQRIETELREYKANPEEKEVESSTAVNEDTSILRLQEYWRRLEEQQDDLFVKILFENFFKVDPGCMKHFGLSPAQEFDFNQLQEKTKDKMRLMLDEIGTFVKDYGRITNEAMKKVGQQHLCRRVEAAHHNSLWKAIYTTFEEIFEGDMTLDDFRALKRMGQQIKDAVVSTNYEEKEQYKQLYAKVNASQHEIEEAQKIWKKLILPSRSSIGKVYFESLFTLFPEIKPKFPMFKFVQNEHLDSEFLKVGSEVTNAIKSLIPSLSDPDLVNYICQQLSKNLKDISFSAYDFYLLKEALLVTVEKLGHSIQVEITKETKWAITKAFKIVRNLIFQKDMDEVKDPKPTKLTLEKKRVVERSWQLLKRYPLNISGPILYKNIFKAHPQALDYFQFRNQKNYLETIIVKTQSANVVSTIGRIIEGLDNFDTAAALLSALGEEHRERGIMRTHFNYVEDGIYGALEEVDGPHFDEVVKSAWKSFYWIISQKMLMQSNYNPVQDFEFVDQIMNTQVFQRISQQAISVVQTNQPKTHEVLTSNNQKLHEFYSAKFSEEVDFHHRIAYRFEKAYRLGKNSTTVQKKNFNLEIIHHIGEFTNYIEQDSMSLFYILFFCIYFRNQEMLPFIKALIQKNQKQGKIEKLLEYIEVHGIEKIRNVGESINNIVYHMVLYQAIDDKLRVVYVSVLKQMRFVQLRDSDAVHLVETRDYELIKQLFEKFTTKLNVSLFGYKDKKVMCHTYRKFNQAYFEEILINYKVEQRAAQNYREKFLVTAEDIFITFEMYCKEDYDQQFVRTSKAGISQQQFQDLFEICLRSDSFKIAMVIYTLYLDREQVFNQRMMDLILLSIQRSEKYHEFKLSLLHEHFELLTIEQLDKLVSVYQSILIECQDYTKHPMVSQYNPIKVSLMIYLICWKIEQQQIYSLITKCHLLQDYLIRSLFKYFEKNSNILVLKKLMLEPTLSLSKPMDSFDLLQRMNLQKLLQHPIVIEVVDLIGEGNFSVSSSALSISHTFTALSEMSTIGYRSITGSLVKNIKSLGDDHSQQQNQMQFNIWKISIIQREADEVLLTTVVIAVLLIQILILNQDFVEMFHHESMFFGNSIYFYPELLEKTSEEVKWEYCAEELHDIDAIYQKLYQINILVVLFTFGMFSSAAKQLVVRVLKANTTLNYFELVLQLAGVVIGYTLVTEFYSDLKITNYSNLCRQHSKMTEEQLHKLDRVKTLINSNKITGMIGYKYFLSGIVVQSTIYSIFILIRSKFIGDHVIMFTFLGSVFKRFSKAFGMYFLIFLAIGRILFELVMAPGEGTDELDKYFHMLQDLLTFMVGKNDTERFSKPFGQSLMMIYMFVFKTLLLSLMTAMSVYKNKIVFKSLPSIRNFNTIKNKNKSSYDSILGAISLTFFPINIFNILFVGPVLFLRSKRTSDFLLKIQYVFMIMLYSIVGSGLLLASSPVLVVKMIINSLYILVNNRRQTYRGENVVQFLQTILLAPFIVMFSILVDLVSLPKVLFQESKCFEPKYLNSENLISTSQSQLLDHLFNKLLFTEVWQVNKNKNFTLAEIVKIHRNIFQLTSRLHDLVCRGTRDYEQALSIVQDYNLMKDLSKHLSIPDVDGNKGLNVVSMNVIHNLFSDLKVYNYVDVLFTKHKMGNLRKQVTEIEDSKGKFDSNIMTYGQDQVEAIIDQDNEENQTLEEVSSMKVGPDGLPLKRNSTDYYSFFFTNCIVRSFTNIEEVMIQPTSFQQRQREEINKEMEHKRNKWKKNIIGRVSDVHSKFQQLVKILQGDLEDSFKDHEISTESREKQTQLSSKQQTQKDSHKNQH